MTIRTRMWTEIEVGDNIMLDGLERVVRQIKRPTDGVVVTFILETYKARSIAPYHFGVYSDCMFKRIEN